MMSALGAVSAVLAAPTGFDAQQRAELHLMVRPIGGGDFSSLRNKVKKWLMVDIAQMGKGLAHVGVINNLSDHLSSMALPQLVNLNENVHNTKTPMSSGVHVSRNGALLGHFPKDQIQSRLEAGVLLPTDHYFDETSRNWQTLAEWKRNVPFGSAPPVPPPPASPAHPASARTEPTTTADSEVEEQPEWAEDRAARKASEKRRRSSGGDRSRRKPRKKNPIEAALPGWIACLFAIGAAAALWAWAQNLRDQLVVNERKVTELNESVASLQRQNNILLEMSPAGVVRGVLTSEPSPGKLAVMSGVTVGALRISDVRPALMDVANASTPATEEELAALVTKLQSSLPPALAVTLTDSSGRFELPLPEPGTYAIVSTAFKQSPGGVERLLWLIEFEGRDEPTPVLSLNEQNAISLRRPDLKLSPARR